MLKLRWKKRCRGILSMSIHKVIPVLLSRQCVSHGVVPQVRQELLALDWLTKTSTETPKHTCLQVDFSFLETHYMCQCCNESKSYWMALGCSRVSVGAWFTICRHHNKILVTTLIFQQIFLCNSQWQEKQISFVILKSFGIVSAFDKETSNTKSRRLGG